MIEGVVVSPRRQLVDERGKIVHVLREDDPEFERFGEVYFSWVNPGVVKGWHLHTAMTLNYTCPVGLVKLALWDDREDSSSRGEVMELFLGPDDHRLVTVPPGVWNGFKGVAATPSMVCNCATLPHDPEEIRRRDPFDPEVPYDWALRHG
jgi:dTDP-4-dehydrorhamnose 3,5-epimerase